MSHLFRPAVDEALHSGGRLQGEHDEYLLLSKLHREDFRRMFAQCGYRRVWPDGARFIRTTTSWDECLEGRAAIGRGMNGLVCYGYAVRAERYVALKLSQDAASVPDVVGVPGAHGPIDRCGDTFEVTELVGLGTVEQLAARLSQLDDQEFRDQILFHLTVSLLRSLADLHDRHLYHRDVKPDNLLLDHRGELRVSDFGEATQTDGETLVEDGRHGGDDRYRSPESARMSLFHGEVNGAAVDGWAAALSILDVAGNDLAPKLREIIVSFVSQANVDNAEFEGAIATCIETIPPLRSPAPTTIWALIKEMLAFDPKRRLTPKGALAHPWVVAMSEQFAPHRERVLSLLREFVEDTASSSLSPQNIPPANFENYVPRPDLEPALLAQLQGAEPVILQGLPGVGKSALALRLLHSAKDQFGLILWFNGEQFEQQLSIFLEEAGLPTENPLAVARQFFGSFEERFKKRFLVVVDNAPGKEVLMPGGQTIITAREGWDGAHEVQPLGEKQSRQLVARLLQRDGEDLDRLCSHFAHIPLGLVYACAYMRHHDVTIDDYLESVRRVGDSIALEERTYGRHIPRTMAAQHALMLERLSPGAAQLLHRLATLATDHIDRQELHAMDDVGAFRELRSLALLHEDRRDIFSMHRLLQEMVWGQLDVRDRQEVLRDVVGRWQLPDTEHDIDRGEINEHRRLLPHQSAAAELASSLPEPADSFNEIVARVTLLEAWGRLESGLQPDAAIHRAEHRGDGVWDARSPDRAWYHTVISEGGNRADVRRLHIQAAVAAAEPHATTRPGLFANCLNNLARVEHDDGQRAKAVALMKKALALRRSRFGERSLWVAHSLRNLAVYVEAPELGLRLAEETIAICGERGDAFSDDAASAWHTKSYWLNQMGRPEEVGAAVQKAVDIWREIIPEHPSRFVGLESLITVLCHRGDRCGVLEVMKEGEQLLEIAEGPHSRPRILWMLLHAQRLLNEHFDPKFALAKLLRVQSIVETEQTELREPLLRMLGRTYNKLGQHEYARDVLAAAIWTSNENESEPPIERAYIRYHFGVACQQLRENRLALEAYRWAIRFTPSSGFDADRARFQAAHDDLAQRMKRAIGLGVQTAAAGCRIM